METQDDLFKKMVRKEGRPGIYISEDEHPFLVPGEKMPFTKIDGFLEEFNFRKYIGWEAPVSYVHVHRAEPNLLTRPLLSIWAEEGWLYETAYLLDQHCNLITATVTKMVWCRQFPIFGKKVRKPKMVSFVGIVDSGTIKDELSLLGEKSHLVRIIYSYFKYTQAALVYKIPSNVSVGEWIRNETESERAVFKKAFDEI